MEKIDFLITLASAVLPLIVALLTFILKFAKSAKTKRALEKTLALTDTLQEFIMEAETFKNYSGEEKKQFVLTKANRFAIEHHMRFNDEEVSMLIDRLVDMTNKVNARERGAASLAAVASL